MIEFHVYRLVDVGTTEGFVKIDATHGFRHPIPCAGVRIVLGDTKVDMSRDEACLVAAYIQDAARDG